MKTLHRTLDGTTLQVEPLRPSQWRAAALNEARPANLCLDLLGSWPGRVALAGVEGRVPLTLYGRLPAGLCHGLLEALCGPYLEPQEQARLKAFERYMRLKADYPGLDCGQCPDSGGDGDLECGACPMEAQPPESAATMDLLADLSRLPREMWALAVRRFLDELGASEARLVWAELGLALKLAESRQRDQQPLAR